MQYMSNIFFTSFSIKSTQMGCVWVTCLRLRNSRFYIFGETINHFEMQLTVLSQKVGSKVFRMAKQSGDWNSTHFRLFFFKFEFWYTGIQNHQFCKWPWVLNWSKLILLVDIITQTLLHIMGFIDHSSMCKLNVYTIAHTIKRSHAQHIDTIRKIKVKRVGKRW